MLTLVSTVTDALNSNSWDGFREFQHPDLIKLGDQLKIFLSQMKSPNTIASYQKAYKRFEKWAGQYKELAIYPANEYSIGTYVMTLVKDNKSSSTIKQFLASVCFCF